MVVFFQNAVLDIFAEAYKVQVKMTDYDCLADFVAYAGDHF